MRLRNLLLFLVVALPFSNSNAEIVLGEKDGWKFSTQGWLNGHVSQTTVKTKDDPDTNADEKDSKTTFRVRSGFAPSALTFNVYGPAFDGMTVKGQFGIWGSIQGDQSKYGNGATDQRQMSVSLMGDFGTVKIGRDLAIFMRNQTVADKAFFSIGRGSLGGAGGGYGHMGAGYSNGYWHSGLTYAAPKMSNTQFEIGFYDPIKVSANNGAYATDTTAQPRIEATVDHTFKLSESSNIKLFIDYLSQEATDEDTETKIKSNGMTYGMNMTFGNMDLHVSAYSGKALGVSDLLAEENKLNGTVYDATNEEEAKNDGYFVQFSYKTGKYEITPAYGVSKANSDVNEGFERTGTSLNLTMHNTSFFKTNLAYGSFATMNNDDDDTKSTETILSYGFTLIW